MKAGHVAMNIATAISFLILISNCVLLQYQRRSYERLISQDYYGTSDDNPHLPKLPGSFSTIAMTVEKNNKYSLVDDTQWARVFPKHRGFVRLGPKGRAFAVAVYHQFHCVNALRYTYTIARDGLVTDTSVLKKEIPHNNHCFQFIRQSILCKADAALVPIGNRNMSLGESGFGVTHRCRSWPQVREFVGQNEDQWEGIPYLNEEDN